MADFQEYTPTYRAGAEFRTEFRYPADLMTPPFDKWITFRAKAGRHILRRMVGTEETAPDTDVGVVHLYLPESALKSTLAVEWGTTDLGPFAGKAIELLAQSAQNIAELQMNSMQSFWDTAVDAGKGIVEGVKQLWSEGGAGASEAAKADLFKGTAGRFVGDDALVVATGQKVNPRTDILFEAQRYRSYNLDFMMVPRNRAEAIAIDNIVEFFQFYMLPSYKGQSTDGKSAGYMMGFPYEFEIGMYSAGSDNYRLQHIAQIGRSVLKGVTVDHAAGGKVSFIRDDESTEQVEVSPGVLGPASSTRTTHYPVATLLSLEFQECRLLGRGDWEIQRGNHAFPDPRK